MAGALRSRRLSTRSEARRSAMDAAGLRIRKRQLHRVPRARGRYRTAVAAVADTSRAAMSRTCTGADSCPAYSRASSNSGAAASSASASSAAVSEQRAGRCDQQCRYGDYCKKLGYPRHYDLLFVFSSASKAAQRNPPRPCSFVRSKLGHPRMFHAKKKVGTPLLMGWNSVPPILLNANPASARSVSSDRQEWSIVLVDEIAVVAACLERIDGTVRRSNYS